jgi:ribosomal protein S27AE
MENTVVAIEDVKEQSAEAESPAKRTETPYNVIRSTLEEDEAVKKDPELSNKKVTCPDCGKSVMAKTLQYTHKFNCKKAVTKKEESKTTAGKETEEPRGKVMIKPKAHVRAHKYSHTFF